MNIRPAQFTDMPDIMGIFDHARKFMRENGNPYQWTDGYPPEELMETETASSAKTKRTAW